MALRSSLGGPVTEISDAFACFGSECSVHVIGEEDTAREAVAEARAQLRVWHERFTRFAADSELSRLNGDPRTRVPVSTTMAQFVEAAVRAAHATGGLVDPTLLRAVERAGYRSDLRGSLPLPMALRMAPARRSAAPHPAADWRLVRVDPRARVVTRPPDVRLDSGGIAKGLFADLLGQRLDRFDGYVVNCAGDLRMGGATRVVEVASPFDGSVLHRFVLTDRGVATSGIGRRSWLDADARPAHHLLDPATGRPAYTGIVQATAIAPTAVLAETRSKAALLSGPEDAARWLPDGGLLVYDDATHDVVEPRD